MRKGRANVRLCDAPLISEAGATVYTSPTSRKASSSKMRPSEWMPSSFVRRIRVIKSYQHSAISFQLNQTIHDSLSFAES
jgi:hypothetical protein